MNALLGNGLAYPRCATQQLCGCSSTSHCEDDGERDSCWLVYQIESAFGNLANCGRGGEQLSMPSSLMSHVMRLGVGGFQRVEHGRPTVVWGVGYML